MKISYRIRVIIYFSIIAFSVISIFIYFQYLREREYKIKSIYKDLKVYANIIGSYPSLDSLDAVDYSNIANKLPEYIHISIVRKDGAKIFGNLKNGEKYLSYTISFENLKITTSSEYELIIGSIHTIVLKNQVFLSLAILIILILLLYFVNRTRLPFESLKEFIDKIEGGKENFEHVNFPKNEFGDIGERIIRAFVQLENTKKYKQELTHNIAHELKTPITGIRGYLETMLQDENLDEQNRKRFTEKAYNQCMRLSAIISDMSILNNIDEAKGRINRDEINIKSCLSDIKGDLAMKLEKRNIILKEDIDETMMIKGDYFLIYSLFKNLIDNSIEHGGENIEISIKGSIEDNKVAYFNYFDTGKGVSEQHLERIFERFYRSEEGRSRKQGGSGLGLSIVKNAILLHNGQISVKNRDGGGLEFDFSLSVD